MEFAQFIPPQYIAILAIALTIARFENQRWVRARSQGVRGANEAFGAFVDITGGIAVLFGIVFLIAFGFDAGWQPAVGIFIVGLVASMVWAAVAPDNFVVWMVSTFAIWPLMFFIGHELTWFGLLG